LSYELQIALRYLKARRRDAFISITTIFTAVGVMLGVAALIIVLAVMRGFEASLRQRILSLTPQVDIQSYGGSMSNYGEVQSAVARIDGVAGADPFIVAQGMASSAHGLSGVYVRGVEPENPVIVARFHDFIETGSLAALAHDTSSNDGTVAIGAVLADKLKVKVGEPLNLIVPIDAANGDLSSRLGHFTVGAVFATGVALIDNNLMFLDLEHAQRFFGRVGRVDGVEVRLNRLDQTAAVTLGIRRSLGTGYRVSNWTEYNQTAAAGFELLKRVYALVLLMLIGVAAFNLVATLIMVVMEKRKDIAVLMAMGATPRGIHRIFVLKGLIVGAIGTGAGLVFGAAGCFLLARYHFIHIEKKIYGIATLPIDAYPLSFVIVAAASITLCWVAALYPARQASRELPLAIFRS
jgi:lipoprotein-releasing system permease protein